MPLPFLAPWGLGSEQHAWRAQGRCIGFCAQLGTRMFSDGGCQSRQNQGCAHQSPVAFMLYGPGVGIPDVLPVALEY